MKNFTISGMLLLSCLCHQLSAQNINPSAANVIYVNTNVNSGTGTGDSWANAVDELAYALKFARLYSPLWLGNDSLQIFVAVGTYKPLFSAADNNYTNNANRDNSFVMVGNVQLYGGFDPDNGIVDLTDVRIPPGGGFGSILSGDIGIAGNNADNAYHVVISTADVGSALLDGFTITGGNANIASLLTVNTKNITAQEGGGITVSNSSPRVNNVHITDNAAVAGGGNSNFGYSSPVFTNVDITNNTALIYGGGNVSYLNASPVFTNVTIANNTSDSIGGGVYNIYANPVFTNAIIANNTSVTKAGGVYNKLSNPILTNVTISNNIGATQGGGIYNDYSDPILTNVVIANNTAHYGGGIYNVNSSSTISYSIIMGNSALFGGGIYNLDTSSTILKNVSITNNTAVYFGGGIYNENSPSILINVCIANNTANRGGGIYNEASTLVLTNVSVATNTATYRAGGISNNFNSILTINNGIIWGNTSNAPGHEFYNDLGSTISLFGSLYDAAPNAVENFGIFSPHSALTSNPLFTDWGNGDYTLMPGSPAINTGDNNLYEAADGNILNNSLQNDVDLAENSRLQEGTIDMGAFEFAESTILMIVSMSDSALWNLTCVERNITLKLYEPGSTSLIAQYEVIMDENGNYSIDTIQIGVFDLFVKVEGFLQKGFGNFTISPGVNTLGIEEITHGDVNNDNGVSLSDVSILNSAFGTIQGNSDYNPFADLNCVGGINLLDFSALNETFGQVGDEPPIFNGTMKRMMIDGE